jgi:biopolymer transport protein ExbD
MSKAFGGGQRRHDDHTESDNEVDMTPMIDCIMLLLIFFMTTSKMNAQGAIPVPEARHGQASDPRRSIIVSIFEPRGNKEAEIVLGDGYPDPVQRKVAKNDEEIRQYIKEAREKDLKNQVIVKAEERVPARDVYRVSRIVGEFDTMGLFIGIRNREGAGG